MTFVTHLLTGFGLYLNRAAFNIGIALRRSDRREKSATLLQSSFVVSKDAVKSVLSKMKKHQLGKNARIIGEVRKEKDKKVYLKTLSGGSRILDMIAGEQLPRIC